MKILLSNFDITIALSFLSKENSKSLPIQYADFNVLNYLYSEKLEPNKLNQIYFYPDSSALYFYVKFFIDRKYKKIISTDIQNSLLVELEKNQSKIYLLGDSSTILKRVAERLKIKFPKLTLVDYCNGYNFDTEKVITEINKNDIDILFVGLGLGRQEKWILENHLNINAKIILSVGGWFQYLAKNKKRAPLFLRKNHLEWLHKIIVEFPRVWKRYFIGFPLFMYRVLTKQIEITIEKD